jgi:hypothetical protein
MHRLEAANNRIRFRRTPPRRLDQLLDVVRTDLAGRLVGMADQAADGFGQFRAHHRSVAGIAYGAAPGLCAFDASLRNQFGGCPPLMRAR